MGSRTALTGILVALLGLFLALPLAPTAKERNIGSGRIVRSPDRPGSTPHLKELQAAMTPYLRAKVGDEEPVGSLHYSLADTHAPTDAELFEVARFWHLLDESFRRLYKRSVGIPDGLAVYVSPTDRFEVHYATEGSNAVDLTDTYGFSPTNWRHRTVNPNGVPDYVEEVAWALDSAWSMIVDRFGFPQPIPYRDEKHSSQRYIAVLTEMRGDYGRTNPITYPDNTIGSYVEIENDWTGPNWTTPPWDYQDRPLEAAYITAAHEFFHAVQYSMGRSTESYFYYIDDYPTGWLEGTATMMEELAFDYIDDYLQYAAAFFNYPGTQVLQNGGAVYSNSLFALYTYHHGPARPGIDFVWAVHDNGFRAAQPFHQNILAGARSINRTWSDLLGSFYAASYLTAERADSIRFLPDAAKLDDWTAYQDILDSDGSKSKIILPYSMQTFFLVPSPAERDTRYLTFTCSDSESAGNIDVRLLIDVPGRSTEIIPLPLDNTQRSTYKVDGWRSLDRLIVAATNAHKDSLLHTTVILTDTLPDSLAEDPDTARGSPPPILAVYPNPVSRARGTGLTFESEDLLEVTLYTIGGTKIRRNIINRGVKPGTKRRFVWNLANENGRAVQPGTYTALVGREDPTTKGIRFERTKVMVIP